MNKFLFLLNLLAIFALLCAYMSPFINPALSWFFSLFGLIYLPILLLNVLFVILWCFREKKFMWYGLIVILMGYQAIFKLLNYNIASYPENGFELISYNLQGNQLLHGNNEQEREAKYNAFEEFIQNNSKVDIICFQELGLKVQDRIAPIMKEYFSFDEEYRGTKIYSKHPILNGGNIQLESLSHNAAWADLSINDQTVRVYSIHLSSNRVGKKADQILEDPDISENKFWSDIKEVLQKYAYHAKKRSFQLQKVLDHAKQSKFPTIICGDFNDVTQSFVYMMINRTMNDSFVKAGRGTGKSYRFYLPALRIDYIFGSDQIKFHDHQVLKKSYSDHYPILAVMSLDK